MVQRWPDVDAVVVGTSAGGVDALLSLLAALPAPSSLTSETNVPNPTWLLVLHRGARRAGEPSLATMLGRVCQLPLAEAEHGQPLRPGQVLLAPAGYHLLVDASEQGPVVSLSVDEPVLWSRPAIDPLFDSAARVFRARLLAIVLTGASADGSEGARRVRAAGGELWVQDPADASAGTMPQAALDHAGADRVLTLERICQTIHASAVRGPQGTPCRPAP